ncbi:MAG: hypothetical protein ABH863_04205, partial [Candidatus Micrarchaeota archaeon]
DIEKTSYAGSMGWENYYADSKISFSSLPASAPALLGGISARVNKNTGGRYSCILKLTSSTDPKQGEMALYRFTDWQNSALLDLGPTIPIDSGVHYIGIRVNGNNVLCYFDGELQLNYSDDTPFKYGLLSLEQRLAGSHFDNVRAKYQAGPKPTGPNPTAIPVPSVSPSPSPSSSPSIAPEPSVSLSPSGLPGGTCSDGTPWGECSVDKPSYCFKGTLQDKCSLCGCPVGEPFCHPDETCSSSDLISNVFAYNITNNSAQINWTTDFPSDSLVEYGLTPAYGDSASDAGLETGHSLALSSLVQDTGYHYRVTSCIGAICNSSDDYLFNTTAPYLKIFNVKNFSDYNSVNITFDSNYYSNMIVWYGTSQPPSTGKSNTTYALSHFLRIGSLLSATTYYYHINSSNGTLSNYTIDYSFRTAPPLYCFDSDNETYSGRAPAVYGEVNSTYGIYQDSCGADTGSYTEQTEYICYNDLVRFFTANCENCAGGVCSGAYCIEIFGNQVISDAGSFSDSPCLPCEFGDEYGTAINYFCTGVAVDSVVEACSCSGALG